MIQSISDEFLTTFKLSPPETLIQKYKAKNSSGVLFVSQNYVCYKGKKEPPIKIPFIKISDVAYSGGVVEIKTNNNGNHSFKVKHGRSAYNLICHFWENPSRCVDVAAYREAAVAIDRAFTEAAKKSSGEQQVKNKLDLNLVNEVLTLVNDTKSMQNEMINQLEVDGDRLNRIKDKLENVQENLDSANHIMKGIESLPYYLFGGSKKEVKEKHEKKKKEGTKLPEGSTPLIEIDALFKNGGSFSPCTIVFETEIFKIINPLKDKLFTSETQYSYTDVDTITMKTNEYFDITFNTKKKSPITLCSSYYQVILNQLHNRAQREGHEIMVKFQESSPQFEYKEEWIYKITPEKSSCTGKPDISQPFPKLESLFANPEHKRDAEETDKKLDEVSDVLRKLIDDGKKANEDIKQHIEKSKILEDMTNFDNMKTIAERMDNAK